METLITILESTLRVSTPLIFAALGGLLSERAGVVNIALEGFMSIGAFAGVAIALFISGSSNGSMIGVSSYLGFFLAGVAGAVFASFYALMVIKFRADQIVSGTAMNMLALGLIPFLNKIWYSSTGNTPSLEMSSRLVLLPTVLAVVLTFILQWWLKKTPSGLWWEFAGEKPEALEASGVSVRAVRWVGVLMSGFLAGLGGATLSMCLSSSYSRGMVAGRGFMALAALIFGGWRPIPVTLACLLFGLVEALQIRLQGVIAFGTEPVPVQFIQMIPYVATMVILAIQISKKRQAPRSLGLPF